MAQLTRSLADDPAMLEARPVIALPDGTVVAGNMRLRAAVELGWEQIPAVRVDLDPERARVWMLRDNQSYGEWDSEALAALLGELEAAGADLDLLGFEQRELERYLALRPGLGEPDWAPELPLEPDSRAGVVYELGRHRLMCGDATLPEHVARLLGGEEPALCLTDPPYGVDYDPRWRQEAAAAGHLAYAARRVGEVTNDDRADWADAWRLVPGDVMYAWAPSGVEWARHQAALEQAGFELRMECIWAKPHLPISRGHYHVRHEAVLYAVRRGRPARWIGDRKQTTLWEITLDENVMGGHSTQKPVECFALPMRNHEGDVYEPFAGTGSCLIAAEMHGRQCFAMEIEPAYCDVIRSRWEAFGGR